MRTRAPECRRRLAAGDAPGAAVAVIALMREAAEADLELREPDVKLGRDLHERNRKNAPGGGRGKGASHADRDASILQMAQGLARAHRDWSQERLLEQVERDFKHPSLPTPGRARLKTIIRKRDL